MATSEERARLRRGEPPGHKGDLYVAAEERRTRASGLCPQCRARFAPANITQRYCCEKCRYRANYRANRDKILKRKANYYAANPEKFTRRVAASYGTNRDRILKSKAAYYAANRDKFAKQHAAYYAANRKKVMKCQATYRATHQKQIAKQHAAYYGTNRDRILKRKAARRDAKR